MFVISGVCFVYLIVWLVFLDEFVYGIIIGGGDDIELEYYGGEVLLWCCYDIECDEFEIGMICKVL